MQLCGSFSVLNLFDYFSVFYTIKYYHHLKSFPLAYIKIYYLIHFSNAFFKPVLLAESNITPAPPVSKSINSPVTSLWAAHICPLHSTHLPSQGQPLPSVCTCQNLFRSSLGKMLLFSQSSNQLGRMSLSSCSITLCPGLVFLLSFLNYLSVTQPSYSRC